jgi:hypothetical protein
MPAVQNADEPDEGTPLNKGPHVDATPEQVDAHVRCVMSGL